MGSDSPRSNRNEADELAWLRFVEMVRQMDQQQVQVVFGLLQVVKAARGRVVLGGGGVHFLKVSN